MNRKDLEKKLNKLNENISYWFTETTKTYYVIIHDMDRDFNENVVESFINILDRKASEKPTLFSPLYKFNDFAILISFDSMDE